MNPEHGSPPDPAADQMVAQMRASVGEAAVTQLSDVLREQPALLEGVKDLFDAESAADYKAVLRAYPALLSEDGELVAETMAAGAPPEVAASLQAIAAVIARCRASGLQVGLAEHRQDQIRVPDEVPAAVRPFVAQAFVLFSNFTDHRDVEAIDAAMERWERALGAPEWPQVPDEIRIAFESDRAAMRLARYGETGDERDLTAVIEALSEIVEHTLAPPSASESLAQALRKRYDRSGDPEDLERARELADSKAPAQQGPAALQRFHAGGDRADLDAAIAAFERDRRSSDLAYSLRVRHELTGDLPDLDEAIAWGRAAVADAGNGTSLAGALNNLGVALHSRFEQLRDRSDLDAAIESLQAAVDATQDGSPDEPGHRSNLGGALLDRYRATAEIPDLLDGIEESKRAVNAAAPDAPQRPRWLSNLAIGLMDLDTLTRGESTALDEAIALLEHAVDESEPEGAGRPMYLVNLGRALRDRFARTGEQQDFLVALLAFRDAGQLAGERWPLIAVGAARAMAAMCAEHELWDQVREAGDAALAAGRRVYESHLTRSHKEAWLRSLRDVAAMTAYASAAVGRPDQAVQVLDGGRALLLSDALAGDRAGLDRLADLGHDDLRARYVDAAGRVAAAGDRGASPSLDTGAEEVRTASQEVRAAHDELTAAVAAIRRVDGYEGFLLPTTGAELADAAREHPLWYVAATANGGLALLVNTEGAVTGVRIPDLTRSALTTTLERYFTAYEQRSADPAGWIAALDDATRWLWDAVMGPVRAAAPETTEATLVPGGILGHLPLHAAWYEDPDAPTGRRYALDDVVLGYAPNARALSAARAAERRATDQRLLAIEDPRPAAGEVLENAPDEVAAALALFADATPLRGRDATHARVLEHLAGADVLHFACHGATDLDDPLRSAVMLADDVPLTVADLISCRLGGARLAVLSACETAVLGPDLPDEVVSLPSGFLQAGVAGVLASLWAVPDAGTTVLISRFYELWRGEGLEPTHALRAAQQWTRDATRGETHERYPRIEALAGRNVPEVARDLWSQARGHASPHFWGGFSYFGA